MSDLKKLTEAIKAGSRVEAIRLTNKAIEDGFELSAILTALISGMDDVGRRFKSNEIFVPEVLIASRAMKESMSILEPKLLVAGIAPEFVAVIGTVQGDLHDIGKNLVAMMWKGANFKVVDLGTNVPVERFVDAAKTHCANIIGLSALLTTTMPAMKSAVDAIRKSGVTAKIIIGGAPITDAYAAQIGADGFAPDAASAVDVARSLVAA